MGIDLTKYAGHTPGPWDIESYGLGGWDIGKDGAILAARMKWTRRSAESEANGRLIADAPELLAEVQRLRADLAEAVAIVCRYRAETPLGNQPYMIAEKADAVLAKHGGGK